MQQQLDEPVKYKRQMKRAFIVLAVIEFIAMVIGVLYAMHK
jgi:DNA-binding transcriptional regulator of glucitol operon